MQEVLPIKLMPEKKLVLYEGQSETIIVSDGTNVLSLALKRSSSSEPADNPDSIIEPIPDPDGAVYIYVSAIGSNNNDGSSEGQPVESIATAVEKINSLEDIDKDYVIVVDGTLQGSQKIAAADTDSETGAALNVFAKSITIKGINSGTLDGNGTTPLTLNVSEDVPVTIKDLIITNSDADANGVGLEIKGGNIFIENGTQITDNNVCGIYVSNNAKVTMNGGNTAGVYNNDSTFKISGSASIGNIYLGQNTKIIVTGSLSGSGTVATIVLAVTTRIPGT